MKIMSVVLAIIVLPLGYSNYQQGNKIAELYTTNAELKSQLREFTEVPMSDASKKALAEDYVDTFSKERPEEVELAYDESFDEPPAEPNPQENLMTMVADVMQSDQMKQMMESDFMKQQVRMQVTQQSKQWYQGLLDKLMLDEHQKEQLLALLVDNKVAEAELGLTQGAKFFSGDIDDIEVHQVDESFTDQITELLGDDGYKVYQQYEQELPVRQRLQMFNTAIGGEQSLTASQIDDLASAIITVDSFANLDDQKLMQLAQNNEMAEVEAMLKSTNENALVQAQGIMTEEQLELYQGYLVQENQMTMMGLKMVSQMMAGSENEGGQ